MDSPSPVKRRVLSTLDPNTSSPKPPHGLKHPQQPSKVTSLNQQDASPPSPVSDPEAERKRPGNTMPSSADAEPPRKRPCLGDDQTATRTFALDSNDTRQRSTSPDTSSVFDNSAIDTSQATTVTEPDVEPVGPVPSLGVRTRPAPTPIPPRPQPTQTRSPEEIKQRAEILRVRLGLARYKVKTGQPDVPLEELEAAQAQSRHHTVGQNDLRERMLQFSRNVERSAAAVRATTEAKQARRPLPGAPSSAARRELSSPGAERVDDEEDVLPRLPPPRRDVVPPKTPRRERSENEERRLSSSALQNGAASGLLSLSRS
ncbi:hypothetical protein B0T16DRAFT_160682 [Cercophora newfieldiana]|uniref:Uncharacterized protein n=1 Tax=Cercophora newfieldiana TaxID=92897 RepID=A0AA39Y6Q7_9PEZI|nr:hypothetical protein B0T16DRAFT_160682 [Cercophora newfieldiana]